MVQEIDFQINLVESKAHTYFYWIFTNTILIKYIKIHNFF